MLAAAHLECSGLADTIGAHEAENISWSGSGQPVQLERVCRVPVGRLGLEVARQVDDVDGLEGALSHTDAAPDAQLLRDGGDLRRRRNLDTQLACANHLK